jgi:hypothetical protein
MVSPFLGSGLCGNGGERCSHADREPVPAQLAASSALIGK